MLDVGCADGEVSVEVAEFVKHLHGLDIRSSRVRQAAVRAAERNIRNASFQAAAIRDYPFASRSWDVTLFLRVWGKGGGAWSVGEAEFERVLQATRRQALVQAGKPHPERLSRILELCDDRGFDAAWFVQPHLIVANRRGAGARIRALPKYLLLPAQSGPVLVRTAGLPTHPVIRSFDPGLRAAG